MPVGGRWQQCAPSQLFRSARCCPVKACSRAMQACSSAKQRRKVLHRFDTPVVLYQLSKRHRRTALACTPFALQASQDEVVLVADIGGTNCRFSLYQVGRDGSDCSRLFQKTYPTKEYVTFEDAMNSLSNEDVVKQHPPRSAALACAGPVLDNRCVMTNLRWTIDGHALTQRYGYRCAVLNDFEAVGYGVAVVPEEDLVVLNHAKVTPKVQLKKAPIVGPKAVMGPGTGLGEASVVWDEAVAGYKVLPSEGSHATFAPRGWKQRALHDFVERELGHCEVEHVACGSGLERIYRFFQSEAPYLRPELDLTVSRDAPSISAAAMNESDPLSLEAVDMFLSIIGAEAGYMGLRLLASGGVYICGGIAPKMLPRIQKGGLLASFLHEDSRFAKVLASFPLFVVKNEDLGLLGTREYAIRLLRSPELCKETD